MRILMIISGLTVGGAERVVCNLTKSLKSCGHTVAVVNLSGRQSPVIDFSKVDVFNFGFYRWKGFIKNFFSLVLFVRKFSPDVVHSHMYHANLLSRFLKIFVNVPRVVNTVHAVSEGGPMLSMSYKATDFLCDATTSVSFYATSELCAKKIFKTQKAQTVYNIVDFERLFFRQNSSELTRRELSIPQSAKIILSAGRLHHEKDFLTLIEAFSIFQKVEDESYLLIAGDGPQKVELQNAAVKLNIEDKVNFLGFREDIADLMSASDVFVLSSDQESFGLVVVEAMCCGTKTISSDLPAVREVAGDDCYYFSRGNVHSLAQTLVLATRNVPAHRDEMSQIARDSLMKKFSATKIVDDWLRVYNG